MTTADDTTTPGRRHLHPIEPPFDPEYDAVPDTPASAAAEAERAFLGHLLTNPDTAHQHVDLLDPDDYAQPRHQHIHEAIRDVLADGLLPDHPTLLARLQRQPEQLRRTGGHNYLLALRDAAPLAPQLDHYAELIRDAAGLRRLDNALIGLRQRIATADPADIKRTLAELSDLADQVATNFGPTHTGPSHWAPMNLDQVLAGQEVDPPPALLARSDGQHMLYAGAIHTLSGEPGSGKTWIALIATVQELANGHTVTMIDFEDRASRVVGRLLALGATPAQIRDHFRYVRPHAALDDTTRADLEHAIHGATLVILDGVTEAMTLHGLDLSGNADVARFYDLLPRRIADHGPAVVMIDHVVKDNEKQGRWAIGGQHKLAGIDGVAYLVKAIEPFGRSKNGHARIISSKDRPGHVEEIALGRTVAELILDATNPLCLRYHLDAPTAASKDEAGNMRPTHLMERVSKYIEITPGLGKNELLDGRISGKGTYLKRALACLIAEGYIETITGPNRKQSHRSITPFREDEDAMHTNPNWADQEELS